MTARVFFYAPSGALRAPWRILAFLLVAGALAFIVSAGLRLLPRPHSEFVGLAIGSVALTLSVLGAHTVMLRLVDRRPWSFVALARTQATPGRIGAGLALGFFGIGVPSGVLLLAHWLRAQPSTGAMSWGAFALASAVVLLPAALFEELLVRGYAFAVLRESIGTPWALGLTSVVFGLLHLGNPGVTLEPIVLVITAGVFLGLVVILTNSLWAAWMTHFAWNWMQMAVLHGPVSGFTVRMPEYQVVDAGPDWATGGTWGPEGGALAGVGMLMAALVLWSWWRRRHAALVEAVHD